MIRESKKFLNLGRFNNLNYDNMKTALVILLLLVSNIVIFAQTNFELYSIEDTYPICVSSNNKVFYGLTWSENKAIVKAYDLVTGKVVKKFISVLPENPIKLMLAHPSKNLLYLISTRKIDDTENRYIDAVYSLNIKSDKLKLLRKVYYNYKIPNKIGFVENNLVFTTLQEPTYLFNLKKNDFSLLNPNTDYQLLSIAPKQKGFLMLNIKEISQRKVPIYFMDMGRKISDRIAYVNPYAIIKSEVRSIQLQTITLEDSSYSWILNAVRFNCFPLYNFQIAMRPFWLKHSTTLDKAYALSGVLFANDTYMITRVGKSISVYNYTEPGNSAPSNITDADIAKIEEYLNQRNTLDREIITSEFLESVFDGLFYQVYSKNKLKHIAVQQHGSYFELKDYSMLISLIKADFKLTDDKQAKLFQDALNVIFPVDAYNKKNVENYKVENEWVFVRGEAFGNKVGIIAKLNDSGEILEIVYKSAL